MDILSRRSALYIVVLIVLINPNNVAGNVCTGRCVNGGTCVPFERGSVCICPDGFSGSKCDSRSKFAPLIFICDEEAGTILESSADTLQFSPLPIPNGHRPVAVGYSPNEDFIFWVDARNGTLNRAFRNGSDHAVLGNTFSDITDLTIHYHSQILGYIVTQTNLILQQGFDVASISKTIYNGGSDLTSVCFHPNTDLYALDNGLASAILRITDNFTSLERIDKSSAMDLSTMTFDRHGSRLFMVDVVKGTLETCDPLGEDQDVLLTYQDTQPVDIEWYRGSPFWTDAGSYKGIGFMAQRGGPSTGVTNLQQFQRGAGVYVYHGIAYERQRGDDCLEDEFPCNETLCIPISWRCDDLVDCEGEMDEIDCYSESDSIVFVSDLDTSAIFMATTTNLSFTKLPLTDLQTPTAVDYDPVDSMIYWADSRDGSISSAYLNGTNQQKIVTELGTPDGLFFDVQTKMIYWTDVGLSNLGSMHSNGTDRRELLTNLDKPRAIIIVSINRMIYWTDWGDIPKIELCDLNGENRQVVIGNELGWPNGLSYDRIDSRLFWCDALLDKIESSDLYGNDRKLLLDNSHGVLHPFDIIFHHGAVMWTDWNCDCIGVREGSPYAWPKTYLLPGGPFTRPGGFHVFEEISTTTTNTPTTMSTTPTTRPPGPIRVVSSPTSLTIRALELVEMTCGFENAVRFEWQKDNITIHGTENQPVYTILSMTPSDIGYYRCRGEGVNHNGVTEIFTDQASIYITELSNVLIQNARFNINVTSSGDLSDITSEYHSDASEMIENYVQTGLMESGNFEENSLSVVSSNLREGSIIANLNMYVVENGTSSFEIHQNVEDSFQALSAQSDGILDVSTVTITSTSICPTFTWMSRFGEAVFVAGEVNSRYNSTGPKCPFNTTNAHQPVATALCLGDKISKPKWIPDDNCGVFKNVSELLKEISSVEVTEENAEEIVKRVAIVTESTEELTSSDISDISGLVLDTVNQNNGGREFTAFVVSIVNNVGSADTTDLQEAQDSSNAVSNMFEAYETQLNKVDVEEDPFDVSEENLAVQVRNVLLKELDQGFGLSLTGESAIDLSNANITATMGEDSKEQRVGLIAEVRFPPEIASLVDTNVKVIFNVFANPALFSSPSLLNSRRENPHGNTTVNTPVVLLSIGDVEVEGLGQSINLTFTALEPDYVNQQCVFWDQENSLWSPDGCKVVPSKSGTSVLPGSSSLPGVNGSNNDLESSILETYTCACDHLTNFAILMDVHGATGTAYTYLSFIGCAISTICLVISLGTYLWNKKLRSRQTHQIFICLCATLLGLYITFLTMLALDTARDTVEVNPGACGFLAGLIHFFVLSSIAWMGVEGFNTYLVIVKIFNTYIPNFMVKAGLAAWGIPAIIVILTGGIANTKYARQEVCFIRLWSQVGGLLIPVAVVLVANMVIFILVIRQLSKSSQMAGKIKKDSDATRGETIERIKNAIAILVLLGLTWITGYLLLIETFTLVVQALFILFNSFQGLFIFILYCLRKPMVRQQWGLTCSCFEEDVSYGRRVASASESLTAISKFLTSRRKRKYSTGDEVLTGVSSGTDPMPSPSISNPTYSEGDVAFDGYSGKDYGSYKERADESNI